MLPIEFARVSSGNRLTLVLVDTAPLQPTLWAFSRKNALGEAVNDLARREGSAETKIGRWPSKQTANGFEKHVMSIVTTWAQERKLDGAVWTDSVQSSLMVRMDLQQKTS